MKAPASPTANLERWRAQANMMRVASAAALVLNPLAWLADVAHWGTEPRSLGMLCLRSLAGLSHLPIWLACKQDNEPVWLEKMTAGAFVMTSFAAIHATTAFRPTSVAAQGGSMLFIILLYSLVFPAWKRYRTTTFLLFSAGYIAIGFYWRSRIGYGAKHEIFTISIFLAACSIMVPRVTQRIESAEQDLVDAKNKLQATVRELEAEVRLRRERELALDQARQAAESANSAKTRFLANVSHELRTPLTAISGSLRLLARLPMDGSRRALLLETCNRNSERLLKLVNTLLDAQAVDRDAFKIDPKPTLFAELIKECQRTASGVANHYAIDFIFQAVLEEYWLNVDALRFHQILANFLSNAAKHSPVSTAVNINHQRSSDGRFLHVEVVDAGPGIAPAFRAHVFKRFSTAADIDADNDEAHPGGTGLGLAINKALVEAHGGTIGFESEPGAGATFWCRLPLCSPPSAPATNLPLQSRA